MSRPDQQEPENQYPFVEKRINFPCSDHEKRLLKAENSVTSVERVMEQVSTKLDLILAQITKIALLEQKHATAEIDITRAHKKVEDLEHKHDVLALEIRDFMSQAKGMTRMVYMLSATVLTLLVKVLFFAAANGMQP